MIAARIFCPLLLFVLTLLCAGCAGRSDRLQLQVLDAQGAPLPQAQVFTQFKYKRFLRPVVEEAPVRHVLDAQAQTRIPKVRAKGSAGWGSWALWAYVDSAGYDPVRTIIARYESSSTTVQRQWEYPLGKDLQILMNPAQP